MTFDRKRPAPKSGGEADDVAAPSGAAEDEAQQYSKRPRVVTGGFATIAGVFARYARATAFALASAGGGGSSRRHRSSRQMTPRLRQEKGAASAARLERAKRYPRPPPDRSGTTTEAEAAEAWTAAPSPGGVKPVAWILSNAIKSLERKGASGAANDGGTTVKPWFRRGGPTAAVAAAAAEVGVNPSPVVALPATPAATATPPGANTSKEDESDAVCVAGGGVGGGGGAGDLSLAWSRLRQKRYEEQQQRQQQRGEWQLQGHGCRGLNVGSFGLSNLDSDALSHSLSFLPSSDLARFSRSSRLIRKSVSAHAAIMITKRYAGRIRLGVREKVQHASSRRLSFDVAHGSGDDGAPQALAAEAGLNDNSAGSAPTTTVAATASAAAPAAGVAVAAPLPPTSNEDNNNASFHEYHISNSERLHREGAAEPAYGDRAGGSPITATEDATAISATATATAATGREARKWRVTKRDRPGVGGGGGGNIAKFVGKNLDRALLVLHHLECCGDLMVRQLTTLPRLDLFRSLQSRAMLGPSQYLTPHMRAVLVDWCIEVACQFRLSTISLHAAVSALDVCLSKVAVPRCRLQLLGVVCAMIQSQAGGGCQVMSTAEAIQICDSQYNPSQVHCTFNIVVSNTQQPASQTIPATAAEILNRHLSSMGDQSGLNRPLSADWEKHPQVQEHNVIAGLLIDLSLLDNFMFRFRPSTLAAAALFLGRVSASYYSKEEVWVTPFAVVEKTNREVLRLYRRGVCSPFIEPNEDLELRPFGAPGLEDFVTCQPSEADAVRKCVDRLWLVQQDFFNHLSGLQSPQPVLFSYQHMFKGIKDKFVPPGSKRLQAFRRLGLVPRSELDRMLDKHLPTTVTRPTDPIAGSVFMSTSAAAASAAARLTT